MSANTQHRLSILLAAIFIAGQLTGGGVIWVMYHFGGQTNVVFVEGLKSDIWIAPQKTDFQIPYLFHYFGRGRPFGIRVQIWDESLQYRSIEITETIVEYSSGEVIRHTEKWSRNLEYTFLYGGMYMLSDEMRGVFSEHTSVKITLKGQLTNKDGEHVLFKVSESFEPEFTWAITTYYHFVSGV